MSSDYNKSSSSSSDCVDEQTPTPPNQTKSPSEFPVFHTSFTVADVESNKKIKSFSTFNLPFKPPAFSLNLKNKISCDLNPQNEESKSDFFSSTRTGFGLSQPQIQKYTTTTCRFTYRRSEAYVKEIPAYILFLQKKRSNSLSFAIFRPEVPYLAEKSMNEYLIPRKYSQIIRNPSIRFSQLAELYDKKTLKS